MAALWTPLVPKICSCKSCWPYTRCGNNTGTVRGFRLWACMIFNFSYVNSISGCVFYWMMVGAAHTQHAHSCEWLCSTARRIFILSFSFFFLSELLFLFRSFPLVAPWHSGRWDAWPVCSARRDLSDSAMPLQIAFFCFWDFSLAANRGEFDSIQCKMEVQFPPSQLTQITSFLGLWEHNVRFGKSSVLIQLTTDLDGYEFSVPQDGISATIRFPLKARRDLSTTFWNPKHQRWTMELKFLSYLHIFHYALSFSKTWCSPLQERKRSDLMLRRFKLPDSQSRVHGLEPFLCLCARHIRIDPTLSFFSWPTL